MAGVDDFHVGMEGAEKQARFVDRSCAQDQRIRTLALAAALDVEACEKITSFIVLCDSFNVPIVLLVVMASVLGAAADARELYLMPMLLPRTFHVLSARST